MKTLYFKCTLLTDIVLNQKSATEGNQKSLDYIPGSNFLGIVANELYARLKPEESLELFHSGKVRFGDAHPEKDGKRTLRIPASFYKGKLKKMEDGLYAHHAVEDTDEKEYKDFQPKQCRTGFYIFENKEIKEVKVEKSFAIKSAYDPDKRRSKDEQMYGYESLQAGSTWLFEVAMDDEKWAEQINKALVNTKRIGRSRTAQYGLVEIEDVTHQYNPVIYSNQDNNSADILVYADARLIFLDEYGLPTFQPVAKDLGVENGTIDWSKSQIRTFQYAPWNFKRHTRDADRCGIEKGSVFYVETNSRPPQNNNWIGAYQNEGFGKVVYNPVFLSVEPNSNGKARYKVVEIDDKSDIEKTDSDDPLFKYLQLQKKRQEAEQNIIKEVNGFVADNKDKYTKEAFASQWGTIRSIAMQYMTKDEIMDELFNKQENGKNAAYLTHGVAKEKWDDYRRREKLKEFLEQFNKDDFRIALINLSAEMAKISKKGGNN
jgi:hypothetical protein